MPKVGLLCHDISAAPLVVPPGVIAKIYRQCPHCGSADRQYSAQSAKDSHFQITRVGAVLKYECGYCRKQFHTIELCVPADTDPIAFYQRINTLLNDEKNNKEESNLEHP